MIRAFSILSLLAVMAGGCRGSTSEDSPITPLRNMHFQQRYNTQSETNFFPDRRTMRTPPAGTVPRFPGGTTPRYVNFNVARDESFDNDRVTLGHEEDSPAYVQTIPTEVVEQANLRLGDGTELTGMNALLQRGQQRYGIYCTPCHGALGNGQGVVWSRGQGGNYQYPQPANLHDDRLRHIPDGQLYATIANGVRNMPGYAAQIPVQDRWAVVAYVRALQVSQSNNGAPQ